MEVGSAWRVSVPYPLQVSVNTIPYIPLNNIASPPWHICCTRHVLSRAGLQKSMCAPRTWMHFPFCAGMLPARLKPLVTNVTKVTKATGTVL